MRKLLTLGLLSQSLAFTSYAWADVAPGCGCDVIDGASISIAGALAMIAVVGGFALFLKRR